MEEAGCKLERPGSTSKEDEESDQKPFAGACAGIVSKFKEHPVDDNVVELSEQMRLLSEQMRMQSEQMRLQYEQMRIQSEQMRIQSEQMRLQSERLQKVETEVQSLSAAVHIFNESKQKYSTRKASEPVPGSSQQGLGDRDDQSNITGMLKIGALNVNSIKERTKPGDSYDQLCRFVNKYDMFCCSETKLRDEGSVIAIDGYEFYNQPRKMRMKKASGGIGFFVNRSVLEYVETEKSESEFVQWLKLSKSLCGSTEDVMIGNMYIPPDTSKFYSKDERRILEEEISWACKLCKYVLLTGDMNARTGISNYVKPLVIDECKRAIHPDGFDISESRTSQDLERNTIGEWLIETCTANKLYILNGRFGKDKDIGKFTFGQTSVIDYTICTAAVLTILEDFEIIKDVSFGGHSLVKTVLKCRKT